jgi:DNA-binding HxlR family transcriptional regulator
MAAVRRSRSGRPIMAALDLLGRRWALRVLWELRDGALTFRELRARCDEVSPTVLNQRLAELREAGIVAHEEALAPLHTWAANWGRRKV